jgi:hypothetical protein
MMRVEAWLEGTRPLLQRRVWSDGGERRQRTPEEEAELSAYRDGEGALCLPTSAVLTLLREAGARYQVEATGQSVRRLVPAAVDFEGETVPLFASDRTTRLRTFAVDSRPVALPPHGSRILRHRPRLEAWTARVRFSLEEALLPPKMVQKLFVDGGRTIGLGDFRAEHGGPFGMFRVAAWHDAEEAAA